MFQSTELREHLNDAAVCRLCKDARLGLDVHKRRQHKAKRCQRLPWQALANDGLAVYPAPHGARQRQRKVRPRNHVFNGNVVVVGSAGGIGVGRFVDVSGDVRAAVAAATIPTNIIRSSAP